jgi:hypothetical protein
MRRLRARRGLKASLREIPRKIRMRKTKTAERLNEARRLWPSSCDRSVQLHSHRVVQCCAGRGLMLQETPPVRKNPLGGGGLKGVAAQDRNKALRQFLAAIHCNLRQAMGHPRDRKPVQKRGGVGVQAPPSKTRGDSGAASAQSVSNVLRQQRIGDGLMNMGVAAQEPAIRQCGMRRIEKEKFASFVSVRHRWYENNTPTCPAGEGKVRFPRSPIR